MRKLRRSPFGPRSTQRRRFSPLVLVGVIVSLAISLIGAVVFVLPHIGSHAADGGATVNMNCTIIVPPHPLTAQGLATPFQLTATDPEQGPCNEGNPKQAVFVQGAVIDPATGHIAIYNPLVVDKDTQPAIAPMVPQLPPGGIVALWGGGNDNNTTLRGINGSLNEGHCVNGIKGSINGSIFGQVWYCNAPAFFQAANQAIAAGKLVPPPLGIAKDGLPCPSVRDFSMVDQDQSDNVTTNYLVTGNGQTAQLTAANVVALPNFTKAANGSDNRLLDSFIDPTLGCTPWMAPDLADPGHMVPAQPLNELQAAAHQTPPVAVVPTLDPMVTVADGNTVEPNLRKLNRYRMGVDQPVLPNLAGASTKNYCLHLQQMAPPRLQLDAALTGQVQPPDPAVGTTLFTFLAQRFVTTFTGALGTGLNCMNMFDLQPHVVTQQDGNGVAISAIITINGVDQCFNSQGIVSPMSLCNGNGNGDGNGNSGTPQVQPSPTNSDGNGNSGTPQVQPSPTEGTPP